MFNELYNKYIAGPGPGRLAHGHQKQQRATKVAEFMSLSRHQRRLAAPPQNDFNSIRSCCYLRATRSICVIDLFLRPHRKITQYQVDCSCKCHVNPYYSIYVHIYIHIVIDGIINTAVYCLNKSLLLISRPELFRRQCEICLQFSCVCIETRQALN